MPFFQLKKHKNSDGYPLIWREIDRGWSQLKVKKISVLCLYGLSASIGASRLTLVLLNLSFLGFSQTNSLTKGEKQFEKLAYFDLIKTYEKLIEKGISEADIHEKLADAYYFNAEYLKALNHYKTLYENFNYDLKKENYFRYGLCLKTAGKKSESEMIFKKMHEIFPEDTRPKRKNEIAEKQLFKIEPININTTYSEYGGQIFNEQFFFASNRPQNKLFERIHSWTNSSFVRLYQGNISNNNEISAIKPLKFEKNFSLNESSACLTKDGQTLYFTRNVKRKKNEELTTNYLKIYRANLINDTWSNVEELSINIADYNTAHPSLSADEKTLYFASDRPGGFGDVDLYKAFIHADGRFSIAENLGASINTEGKETFPFMCEDGLLYFSSNGHLGLGGLDVFVAKFNQEQVNLQNLGLSINSVYDDFSFNINSKTKKGFYSSNSTKNNKGKDDIYAIKQIETLSWPNTSQHIFVFDLETNQPIFGANIQIKQDDLKTISTNLTNKDGSVLFNEINLIEKQIIQVTHADYEPTEIIRNSELKASKIYLKPKKNTLEIGDDLAKIFSFKQIFFDLDKWSIRADALADMHKILQIMQDYAHLRIKIRSHTDCRNTVKYNLTLSEKRANATKNWLIEKGIKANRLEAEGLGELELVNDCACEPKNDSTCDESEHQANRRSEFIVIVPIEK